MNPRTSGEMSWSELNGETPSNWPLMAKELSSISAFTTAMSGEGVVVRVLRFTVLPSIFSAHISSSVTVYTPVLQVWSSSCTRTVQSSAELAVSSLTSFMIITSGAFASTGIAKSGLGKPTVPRTTPGQAMGRRLLT